MLPSSLGEVGELGIGEGEAAGDDGADGGVRAPKGRNNGAPGKARGRPVSTNVEP